MSTVEIVVADDEQEIRDLVAEVLEEVGYIVHAFGDGLSALAAIRAARPAVVLLDVAMPVMTGDETLRQLRADGIVIPVIMMTAATNPQRLLQVGATAVLPKPFELGQLITIVAGASAWPGYGGERALGETSAGRWYVPR